MKYLTIWQANIQFSFSFNKTNFVKKKKVYALVASHFWKIINMRSTAADDAVTEKYRFILVSIDMEKWADSCSLQKSCTVKSHFIIYA